MMGQENAKILYQKLRAKGVPEAPALGMMVNAWDESRFEPGATSYDGGGGLWQWTPWQGKIKLNDMDNQVDVITSRPTGTFFYNGLYSVGTRLKTWDDYYASTDPVECAQEFTANYERPAVGPAEVRIQNSAKTVDWIKGLLGSDLSTPGASQPTEEVPGAGTTSTQVNSSQGKRFYQIDDQTYKNDKQVFRKLRDNVWVLTTLNSDGASQVVPNQGDNNGGGSNPGGGGGGGTGANTDKIIQWFTNHIGKLTYSMTGSRIGTDGTADCSGSMAEAMKEAGYNVPNAQGYSTENFHGLLLQNGFKLISEDKEWDAKRGDIVIFGRQGYSAGADGHIMIMTTPDKDISTCYATFGAPGTAVAELNFNNQWKYSGCPYFYVYRLQ